MQKYVQDYGKTKDAFFSQFESDKVLIPRETAWFGYYGENNFKTITAANEVGSVYIGPPFFFLPGHCVMIFLYLHRPYVCTLERLAVFFVCADRSL